MIPAVHMVTCGDKDIAKEEAICIARGCHRVYKTDEKDLIPGEYLKHENPSLPGNDPAQKWRLIWCE